MNLDYCHIIDEIESFSTFYEKVTNVRSYRNILDNIEALHKDIIGNSGTFIIRCICHLLNFDEHQLCKWRLEHKLIQNRVLEHYLPRQSPITVGLKCFLNQNGKNNLEAMLAKKFPQGFLIKHVLNSCSGDHGCIDCSKTVLSQPGHYIDNNFSELDELYIIQEFIPIVHEYRVHSIDGNVIPNCTSHRFLQGITENKFTIVNQYVQHCLDNLPIALKKKNILAWDIAERSDGKYIIIEINITGYHPVYRKGFQCSGFFQNIDSGPLLIARVLCFLNDKYDIKIVPQKSWGKSKEDQYFIKAIQKCCSMLYSHSNISTQSKIKQIRNDYLSCDQLGFDVLIPVLPEDLEILSLLIYSLKAYCSSFPSLFFITKEVYYAQIRKQLKEFGVIVSDKFLLTDTDRYYQLADWQWREIVALYASRIFKNKQYLILEPNVFVVKNILQNVLIQNQKAAVYRYITGLISPWYKRAAQILGCQISSWTYNHYPCMFNAQAVQKLLEGLCNKTLAKTSPTSYSEILYEYIPFGAPSLYYTFLESTQCFEQTHFASSFQLLGNYICLHENELDWNPELSFAKERTYIFSKIPHNMVFSDCLKQQIIELIELDTYGSR